MIQTVILDVDGTLVDSNYLHVEAWSRAFRAVGLSIPRASIHKQIGKGSDLFLPTFVTDPVQAEQANQLHSESYAALAEYAYPLPGARELLASLAERGYQAWLATSAKKEELDKVIDDLDARERLAGVITSEDVEGSKPRPDIFPAALTRSGASVEEAVAVGDTVWVWDVEAANRGGLRCVTLLTGGAYSRDELMHAGAVEVFQDAAALLSAGFPEGF